MVVAVDFSNLRALSITRTHMNAHIHTYASFTSDDSTDSWKYMTFTMTVLRASYSFGIFVSFLVFSFAYSNGCVCLCIHFWVDMRMVMCLLFVGRFVSVFVHLIITTIGCALASIFARSLGILFVNNCTVY